MNRVFLLGHLGRDPELRVTASQQQVCTFSLATSERTKDGERTEWHKCVVFGKVAENCHKYLNKGSQALVEGKVQTRKWEDKQGQARYTTEVIAHSVQFVGKAAESAKHWNDKDDGERLTEPLETAQSIVPFDDDIPF